jgi:hypothetical protein
MTGVTVKECGRNSRQSMIDPKKNTRFLFLRPRDCTLTGEPELCSTLRVALTVVCMSLESKEKKLCHRPVLDPNTHLHNLL